MNPAISALVTFVSDATGVPVSTILSKDRRSEATRARAIVCYIAHNMLGFASVEVGRSIDRDHATILSACKNVKQAIESGRESQNFIAGIVQAFENSKASTNLAVDSLLAAFHSLSSEQKVVFLSRVAVHSFPKVAA